MTKEDEIYALIGVIVERWNYVESCVRQITRQQKPGGRLGDAYHNTISGLFIHDLEQRVKREVLPNWRGSPGVASLSGLIEAVSIARVYRNHYVHGFSGTTMGPDPQAIFSELKPKSGMIAMRRYVSISDLLSFLEYIAELGVFAQEVMVAFDTTGQPAKNNDGTLVVKEPRNPIKPLPKLDIKYVEVPPPVR